MLHTIGYVWLVARGGRIWLILKARHNESAVQVELCVLY